MKDKNLIDRIRTPEVGEGIAFWLMSAVSFGFFGLGFIIAFSPIMFGLYWLWSKIFKAELEWGDQFHIDDFYAWLFMTSSCSVWPIAILISKKIG